MDWRNAHGVRVPREAKITRSASEGAYVDNASQQQTDETDSVRSVCPNCGAVLEELRGKLQCPRCHLICETCCEGGRG